MKLGVAEILEKVSKLKSEEEKIALLRANNTVALQTILKGAFDPGIIWELPEGVPPYKPNDLVDQQHRFYAECRKMYLFIKGGHNNLTPLKRERLYIELLESIDPADANLLIAIKDKKMPYTGITLKLINKAIPGLIPT